MLRTRCWASSHASAYVYAGTSTRRACSPPSVPCRLVPFPSHLYSSLRAATVAMPAFLFSWVRGAPHTFIAAVMRHRAHLPRDLRLPRRPPLCERHTRCAPRGRSASLEDTRVFLFGAPQNRLSGGALVEGTPACHRCVFAVCFLFISLGNVLHLLLYSAYGLHSSLICICLYTAMHLPATVSIGVQVELTRTRAQVGITMLHFMYFFMYLKESICLPPRSIPFLKKNYKVNKRAVQQSSYEASLQR